ncbi:MAG TPA: hypothetical protein VMN60_06090 [Longimicrobiales bacterium]|nr:hypothetical protein [Longimicrobiales bacterium]
MAVLKPFNSDPLTVEFEIVTAAGTALASGRATVVGDDEQRQIASQLVVRGGTGAFTNATGRLRARGSVRTRERTLHVQYDGLICAPANELTQTRERRQNALAVAS